MSEPVKLKKGCSFLFEGQKYRGGAARNHTIPAGVVARINLRNEAAKKKNSTLGKGDDGFALINLEKITAPEEKPEPAKKKDGGKP